MKLSTSLLILLLSSPILAHRTQRKNPKQSKKYKSHNSFQVGTFPEKESVSESSIGKSSKDIQDGPKIKMDTFIQSVENGMSEDEASELFLINRSPKQYMNLFKKSIESVSPKSALISGKYCQEVATDSEVDSLMKLHYKSCRSGVGLKTEMTDALKSGSVIVAPTDWPRECKSVCINRLRGIVANLTRHYNAREDIAVTAQDESDVFSRLCLPVLEVIMDSCGQRDGIDIVQIAKMHAEAGNKEVITKAIKLGYLVIDDADPLGSRTHVPHLLLHHGFTNQAAEFLSEHPQYSALEDKFGISAGDLLKAKTSDWTKIPPEASHLVYYDKYRSDQTNEGSTNYSQQEDLGLGLGAYQSGGWPTNSVPFPGWDGQCEIAELDGKAVAESPDAMVLHFLLTQTPVIIRDFMSYDVGGTDSLLTAMSRSELVEKWGDTEWDIGSIPYETTYTGEETSKQTLEQYVTELMKGGSTKKDVPQYIFSDPFNDQKGTRQSAADMFPQNPNFIRDGLKDVMSTSKGSGQFYLGGPGTGAAVHYHSNTAWNGLVYGRKGWVLTPPPGALFSDRPAIRKVYEMAERGEGLRCVQEAGDVIMAPPYWGHLTYNLATSIGMAKEFEVQPAPKKLIEIMKNKKLKAQSISKKKKNDNKFETTTTIDTTRKAVDDSDIAPELAFSRNKKKKKKRSKNIMNKNLNEDTKKKSFPARQEEKGVLKSNKNSNLKSKKNTNNKKKKNEFYVL